MNEIILDILVEKCFDLMYIKNRIEEYMGRVEAEYGIGININILLPSDDSDNKLSDKCKVNVKGISSCISNVLIITQLVVPEQFRNNGIGTNIIYSINDALGISSLILVNSGILQSEYPSDRYTLTGEKGKINLDGEDIIKKQEKFWSERNFFNANKLFNHGNFQIIFIFSNPIGLIVQQYLLGTIVTRGHLIHQSVEKFYTKALEYTTFLKNDKDIFMFPFVYSLSSFIADVDETYGPLKDRNISESYGSKSELINQEWYSGFNKTHDRKDLTTLSVMAYNYRLVLCQLGGAEVYIQNQNEIININSSMVMFNSGRVIEDTDSEHGFITMGDHALVFRGYILNKEDNIWLYGKWYYNPKDNYIYYNKYDFNGTMVDDPEIFVGEISKIR